MTEENTGSTELSEIKKVDDALESREQELQDLKEAIGVAESQLDSVTGREIIGIEDTPVCQNRRNQRSDCGSEKTARQPANCLRQCPHTNLGEMAGKSAMGTMESGNRK